MRQARHQALERGGLTEEEIAASIAAVLDGSLAIPERASKADAIALLLEELPDAPDAEVAKAVANLVVEGE